MADGAFSHLPVIFYLDSTNGLKVKNSGETDLNHVTIAFRVTDGTSRMVLSAEVPAVGAGKTVDFRTPVQVSRTGLRLVEEDPGITVGR